MNVAAPVSDSFHGRACVSVWCQWNLLDPAQVLVNRQQHLFRLAPFGSTGRDEHYRELCSDVCHNLPAHDRIYARKTQLSMPRVILLRSLHRPQALHVTVSRYKTWLFIARTMPPFPLLQRGCSFPYVAASCSVALSSSWPGL